MTIEQFPTFQPEKKKKPAIWKEIKKYSKIAALSALFSFPMLGSAVGQEKGEKENSKTSIEQLTETAAGHVKNIVEVVKKNGQKGTMNLSYIGTGGSGNIKDPFRRLESPDKKTVTTVGYSDDESKAKWLIYENEDASLRLFDNNADGSVDRAIINKADPNSKFGAPKCKRGFNDFKTFQSIESLADEADVVAGFADLDPEETKTKIYEISLENGNYIFKVVDFKSGEASILSGPDAEELTSKIQGSFTNRMKNLDNQLKK